MNRLRFLLVLAAAPLLAADARFTDELWRAAKPIYDKTLQHPFITGLTDGTLPRNRFQLYMEQDTLYLGAYGKAIEIVASKAPNPEWAATLRRHAAGSTSGEKQLHDSILKKFGVDVSQSARQQMLPTNYAYVSHMIAVASQRPFAEGLAAILPCYWIYLEVGRELKKKGSPKAEYQQWIDQYASEGYSKSVNEALAMMNAEAKKFDAATRERVIRNYVISSRYEWMFWDMAWREERWLP